eukprot:6026569-Pyramimonas_sp.AAC.3
MFAQYVQCCTHIWTPMSHAHHAVVREGRLARVASLREFHLAIQAHTYAGEKGLLPLVVLERVVQPSLRASSKTVLERLKLVELGVGTLDELSPVHGVHDVDIIYRWGYQLVNIGYHRNESSEMRFNALVRQEYGLMSADQKKAAHTFMNPSFVFATNRTFRAFPLATHQVARDEWTLLCTHRSDPHTYKINSKQIHPGTSQANACTHAVKLALHLPDNVFGSTVAHGIPGIAAKARDHLAPSNAARNGERRRIASRTMHAMLASTMLIGRDQAPLQCKTVRGTFAHGTELHNLFSSMSSRVVDSVKN